MYATRMTLAAMALASMNIVNAAIVEDGLWTGNDWYDETSKIGV